MAASILEASHVQDIQKDVTAIVRQQAQLDHDPAPDAELLTEAGIDSLMALRILASIEKTFDVRIPDERLMEMTTVERIAHFITEARRG